MALFEPTNFKQTETTGTLQFDLNRYRKIEPERRGFLTATESTRTDTATTGQSFLKLETQKSQNQSLLSISGLQSNAPVTSLQRGTDIYRRNNDINNNTFQKTGRPDTFQQTFPALLSRNDNAVKAGLRSGNDNNGILTGSARQTQTQAGTLRGITEYLTLKPPATKTTNKQDLYIKTGSGVSPGNRLFI